MLKNDLSLQYLEHDLENSASPRPVLIFLHGRMANELDLFDLAPAFENHFRVLSVRAPIVMGLSAFGWFHTEYLPSGPIHNAQEYIEAKQLLLKFILEIKAKFGVQNTEIFLMGFSQGAIMSFGLVLDNPFLVGGIACLSGRILPEDLKAPGTVNLSQLPVFISHGIKDEILSIQYARNAKAQMEQLGAAVTYFEYDLHHDITDVNFPDVKQWLIQRVENNN